MFRFIKNKLDKEPMAMTQVLVVTPPKEIPIPVVQAYFANRPFTVHVNDHGESHDVTLCWKGDPVYPCVFHTFSHYNDTIVALATQELVRVAQEDLGGIELSHIVLKPFTLSRWGPHLRHFSGTFQKFENQAHQKLNESN